MADTLADLEHRPGRLGWAAGPGELQRPVCGGCAAAGRGTGGAVMGTSRTVIMWTGLWLSHLCRLVTAGHRLLSSCPLPPPATTAYLSRSPPHCCCVTCNWSAQSPSPPFHAPAAELENICAAMTSLFQPLHGGRGGAAALVTFKPWSSGAGYTGSGSGYYGYTRTNCCSSRNPQPTHAQPDQYRQYPPTHPKLQNWVKNTFISFIYPWSWSSTSAIYGG